MKGRKNEAKINHEMTIWEGNPTGDEEESREGISSGLSDAEPRTHEPRKKIRPRKHDEERDGTRKKTRVTQITAGALEGHARSVKSDETGDQKLTAGRK
jgi:hypothetical protein